MKIRDLTKLGMLSLALAVSAGCEVVKVKLKADGLCKEDTTVDLKTCKAAVQLTMDQANQILNQEGPKNPTFSSVREYLLIVGKRSKDQCRANRAFETDEYLLDSCFAGVQYALEAGLPYAIEHAHNHKSTCGCRDAQKGP